MSFSDLKLTRQFLDAVAEAGYEKPTPIQERAIPAVLSGQHVLGIAQTGTGKTAAYLLPTLQLLKFHQDTGVRALVLAPVKELVVQIAEHAQMLAKHTDLQIAALYGGVGVTNQKKRLAQGIDLVVSTPKRLFELYESGALPLGFIKIFVLDEADRMMDMGFLPQLEMVLDLVPRKKQVLLFSATFSPRVEKLSENFLDFPVKIEIAPEATTAETVDQYRYAVPNRASKLNLLAYLLQDKQTFHRVIVFAKTKENADAIAGRLNKSVAGPIKVIHSNKGQNARINAMQEFKEGGVRILVATDVAARGIDITAVSHVINFDVPLSYDDYVHRVGRTGRAEMEGTAFTFFNDAEEHHIQQIERRIRKAIPLLSVPQNVTVEPTPFEEQQTMLREIDARRRKEDPTFQGAFHEKQRPKPSFKQKASKAGNTKKKSFSLPKQESGRKKTSKHGRHRKQQ